MPERKYFDCGEYNGDIILHPDGTLTIESEGDYGDSEIGWGSVITTVYLSPEQVQKLREFLAQGG